MATKGFTVRIDDDLLEKLHAMSDYEGRSANSQINYLIRQAVENFEKSHGKIETAKKNPTLPQRNN